MNYLAYRDHAANELTQKLQEKYAGSDIPSEASSKLIQQIIDDLADERILDDARFAKNYIESKFKKGIGPLKIIYELKNKGVEQRLIQTGIGTVDSDEWIEAAKKARVKRFGEALPATQGERQRQMRFLMQRGYNTELVNQIWRNK